MLVNKSDIEVITPVYKLNKEKINDPNTVKVVIRKDGNAIYFSNPIPFVRDEEYQNWHKKINFMGHVGIYGYRADVLKKWFEFPRSELENAEKLEQLRLIDSGISIKTLLISNECISIDTQTDLDEFNKTDKYLICFSPNI